MAVSHEEFRQALGRFASGVTVVTSLCEDGQLRGLTVSSFASVSLDPPLVLACVDRQASLHDHLCEGCHFVVNILAEDQERLSRRFASKDPDKFNGVGYTTDVTGSPLLDGCLAYVECRVVHAYPGGDHTIFVGQVEAVRVDGAKPLLYFRGGYNRLA